MAAALNFAEDFSVVDYRLEISPCVIGCEGGGGSGGGEDAKRQSW